MKHYYDTVDGLPVEEVSERGKKGLSQENEIYKLMSTYPQTSMTPFAVMTLTGIQCINSVRRAMTNLTKQGKIKKTSLLVMSPFGHKNHTWIYNNDYGKVTEEKGRVEAAQADTLL